MGFLGGSDGKESTCSARDLGSTPGLGRSPGGGHGNPLQYYCLGESPWTEEPSGLQSRGSQRVRHDWATPHRVQWWESYFCRHVDSDLLVSFSWWCRTHLRGSHLPGKETDVHLPSPIWHVWGMLLEGLASWNFWLILSQPRIRWRVSGMPLACVGYRSSRDMGGALPVSAVMGKWHMPGQPQCPLCLAVLTTGKHYGWAGSVGISPGINASWLLKS